MLWLISVNRYTPNHFNSPFPLYSSTTGYNHIVNIENWGQGMLCAEKHNFGQNNHIWLFAGINQQRYLLGFPRLPHTCEGRHPPTGQEQKQGNRAVVYGTKKSFWSGLVQLALICINSPSCLSVEQRHCGSLSAEQSIIFF